MNRSSPCVTYSLSPTSRNVMWPRLAELTAAPTKGGGLAVDCAADPFGQFNTWRIAQCTRWPLLPPRPTPADAIAGSTSVLLAVTTSSNVPLLSRIEAVLRQLHAARVRGLVPTVFLGANPFVPVQCTPTRRRRGTGNLWDWFFDPVSAYRLGSATFGVHPVRLFVASPADMQRLPASSTRDDGDGDDGGDDDDEDDGVSAPASVTASSAIDGAQSIRQTRLMSRVIRRFVRVRPPLLRMARRLLLPLRARAVELLGLQLSPTTNLSELGIIHTLLGAYLAPGRSADAADDHKQLGGAQGDRLVVLVGAGADVRAALVQRYGAARVVAPEAACGRADGSAVCEGRRELIDALLLAHTDYLIMTKSSSTADGINMQQQHQASAARFATWYNPHLQRAHLRLADLRAGGGLAEVPAANRPVWAGGTWLPPEDARRHARGMMDALRTSTRRLRVDGAAAAMQSGGGAGSAPHQPAQDAAFLPGLPPPVRKVITPASSSVSIQRGTCRSAGARRMRLEECKAFAEADKKHFLGASTDANEYPGCTLWLDTLLVEFNDHTREGDGCNLGGRGKCVCIK